MIKIGNFNRKNDMLKPQFVYLLLLLLGLSACQPPVPPPPPPSPPPTPNSPAAPDTWAKWGEELDRSLEKLDQELKKIGEDIPHSLHDREVVSHERLAKFLPDWVGWLPKMNYRGETTNSDFVAISQAEAGYRNGRKEAKVVILQNGLAAKLGSLQFLPFKFEHSSTEGTARKTTLQGFEGFEAYDETARSGSIVLGVGERFLVGIQGTNVKAATLRSTLEKMNLQQLARLK